MQTSESDWQRLGGRCFRALRLRLGAADGNVDRMCENTVARTLSPSAGRTDDAVGVPAGKEKWFAAVVNANAERSVARQLEALGYETFVPVQRERREGRDGRRRTVECVLIGGVVFVRCTERQRLAEVVRLSGIKRFVTDRARLNAYGRHLVAEIPDDQIEAFRLFLERTRKPVAMESVPYVLGEKVRVVEGDFKGLSGHVVRLPGGDVDVVLCVGALGCARLTIAASMVRRAE